MVVRPTKDQTIELIIKNAPTYIELLLEFKKDAHGWLILPQELASIKQDLDIQGYASLYKDQRTIDICLILALLGVEGTKNFNKKTLEITQKNDAKATAEFFNDLTKLTSQFADNLESSLPAFMTNLRTDAKNRGTLSSRAKQDHLLRKQLFWIHILLGLHNYLSIMVNGESMVSLVSKATEGDDKSLLKAIKIDPTLMSHHPYFIERINSAKIENDLTLLKGLSKYQATPNLESRLKLPGVYMIFAMLELGGWLDEFTHEDILDLCDASGIDRWQHKIEDVNAITKCLRTYRRYQQSGGVSMH